MFCLVIDKSRYIRRTLGDYVRQITEKAGYQYNKSSTELPEVEKYCGKYIIEDGEDILNISYNDEKKEGRYN